MTAVATEALTAEQMVKIAREQVEAFNNGDWERLEAGLAADARYDELGTARKIEGAEKIVELFKGGCPGRRGFSWRRSRSDGQAAATIAASLVGVRAAAA
jgi:hypothetical protein